MSLRFHSLPSHPHPLNSRMDTTCRLCPSFETGGFWPPCSASAKTIGDCLDATHRVPNRGIARTSA